MRSEGRILAFAIALLFCLLPVEAVAQKATVYGTVNDAQGKPARGVVVALDNPAIGFHQTTTSATDGGFRFRQVPPASGYQVAAIVQKHAVSARFVIVNVDDQKEVWPPLVLPPAGKPAQIYSSTNPLLSTAVIYGTVFGARSEPMSGVEVKLENESNRFSKTQLTDEDGSYKFTMVPPANDYRLMASKGGKAFDAQYPIEAIANEEKRIWPPLHLIPELAVANETVSTAISGVITGEQLRGLPLYNRNFLALGLLTPEVHAVEQGSELAGASFSISGARPSSNNFLLDGSDNVASSSNQAVPFQVNDSIQEFRVISSNAAAEYGRNLGGVVNVVTRRGGSAFHGSAYGYFANDALNLDGPLSVYNGTTFDKAAAYAGSPSITNLGVGPPPAPQTAYFPLRYNDYVNIARNNGFCTNSIAGPLANPSTCMANRAGANAFFDPAAILQTRDNSKRPFDSKQFGTSAGGALKKGKLFAFASYEGTRINNPNPIFERVPSAFDKAYNPLNAPTVSGTRTMFTPDSPDYRLAQGVFSLFPAPNVVGVPGVLEFFQGEAPNYTRVHNALVRTDWVKSEKTTISTRYVTQILKQLHDDSLPAPASPGGYPGNGAFRHALNQNFILTLTRNFGSSMVNEAHFGLNRFNVHETAQDLSFDARSLGTAGSNFPHGAMPTILLNGLDPRYSGAYLGVDGAAGGWSEVTGSPTVCGGQLTCAFTQMAPTLDGLFPFARIGPPLNTPNSRLDTTIEGGDNLSFGHGGHDMKTGFAIRVLTNQVRNGAYQRGFLYSANIGEFGHDSETCNQACTARVFPGSPPNAPPNGFLRPSFDFARFDGAPLAADLRSWAPALFFQDTWRISPRVTLNLGTRYEYFSPPLDRRGQTWNFDPIAGGLVPSKGTPTTVDPYGNPCGSADSAAHPLDRSLPLGGFHFPPAGSWTNCSPRGDSTTVRPDYRDFAPRLGIAWDIFGNGKTVLRAGTGLFWDQLPANYVSQLIFNRPVTGSNAVYGQLIDARVCPRGALPFSAAGCGLGNSIMDPARRSQNDLNTDPSTPLPNSYFSEAAFPFAMYARDTRHSQTPLALQSNLTVQRQISNKLALEVGYAGTLGRRLPIIYNSRAATEFDLTAAHLPINTFPLFTMTNQAESSYHSLVARLRAAQWHGWRINAVYAFSRSLDNASSSPYYTEPITLDAIAAQEIVSTGNPGSACFLPNLLVPQTCATLTFPNVDFRTAAVTTTGAAPILVAPYSFPQDPLHFLSDEYGRSDFDVTHQLVVDYTWEAPSPRMGSGWSKWLEYWQFSGIFVAQSGQPFTIFSTLPAVAELTQRVNLAGNGPAFNMSVPAAAISTTGLAAPLPACGFRYKLDASRFCTGNSPRNGFSGPDYVNMDFALQKGFAVRGEGKMLILRTEISNVFNRANYYNPIGQFSADAVNVNPNFGKIKSAHDPLQLQFAARFTW